MRNIDFLPKKNTNEEVEVEIQDYVVSFCFTFLSSEDVLKISYKVGYKDKNKENSSKLLTLMSIISINGYNDLNQVAIKTCTVENNIKYNICYIEHFRKKIIEKSGNLRDLCLKVNLKICYSHTEIANYIVKNFTDLYSLKTISKVSKQLFAIIIRAKSNEKNIKNNMKNNNNNNLAVAFLNWRK